MSDVAAVERTGPIEGPDRRGPYDGADRRRYEDLRGDGTQLYAGLPVWLRAVAVVGFPTVLASLFAWFGINYLPRIQTELVTYRIEAEKLRLVLERQANQAEQSYRLLQRICAEVAKTDEGRARCFDR